MLLKAVPNSKFTAGSTLSPTFTTCSLDALAADRRRRSKAITLSAMRHSTSNDRGPAIGKQICLVTTKGVSLMRNAVALKFATCPVISGLRVGPGSRVRRR
jgi:hypothetical protein